MTDYRNDRHPSRNAPHGRQTYARPSAQLQEKSGAGKFVLAALLAAIFVVAFSCCAFPQLFGKTVGQRDAASGNAGDLVSAMDDRREVAATDTVISLKGGDRTIVFAGEEYIEPGCTVTDAVDGMISSQVKISGQVDTSKPGDYTVRYSVTNSRGQVASRERTVSVIQDGEKCQGGVPVMMYHYVYDEDNPPEVQDANFILDSELEKQLQWLTENDYYYPSFAELRAYVDGNHSLPAKSIILTFDDGEPGCLTLGGALMEKYKVPMISFTVCSDNFDAAIEFANPYIVFESHSYNMHRDPCNIGHGGVIHIMDQGQIEEDLAQAASMLTTNDAFAYPYGDVPEKGMEAVANNGILCAFTTNYGFSHVGDDYRKLSRVRVTGSAGLSSFIASVEG